MSDATNRWLKLSAGFAITTGFVWLLVRELNLNALSLAFAGLSVSIVPIALAFLAAGWAVRIVRWWRMLRFLEPNLSLNACVYPFLAGMAVNNVAPFRAGDALRCFGFQRQLQSPVMRVVGTLVIERVLDVSILLGFFLVGLAGLPSGVFPHTFVVAVAWLTGLTMAAILALILFPTLPEHIQKRLPGRRFLVGRHWFEAVSRHGAHLTEALNLVRSPRRMLELIGLSIITWACEGAVFVAMAAAIQADAAPLGPWLSLAAGTLATVIPSAPGHFGTFDYFAAQGLAAYGSSLEIATAFALIVHAVLWTTSTAAGLLYLLCGRFNQAPGRTASRLQQIRDLLNRRQKTFDK